MKIQKNIKSREEECQVILRWLILLLVKAVRQFEGFPGGLEVKNLPAMQETGIWSLGQEDPLEKEMASYCSILALGNAMGRAAWWATIHRITAESDRTPWLHKKTAYRIYLCKWAFSKRTWSMHNKVGFISVPHGLRLFSKVLEACLL